MRPVRLVTASFPHPPGLDTAVSHALALAAGRGTVPETFRLHGTTPIVAFGRQDVVSPGYREAVAAARAAGYEAVERLAGGRAAVFHEGTLAFSWAIPLPDPRVGVHDRFRDLSGIVQEALRRLGADARVGPVPGEYCSGTYSVSVGGRWKVMGVGQRLVRGAAHVGGVVVVSGGDRVREVLVPVYSALGLEWEPATAGDLRQALPGVTSAEVVGAIVEGLSARFDLSEGGVEPAVLADAGRLAADHLAPAA